MNCVLHLAHTVLLSVPAWGYKLGGWRPQQVAWFVSFQEVLQKRAKSQVRSANIYFRFVCVEPDTNPHTNPAIFTKWKSIPLWVPTSELIFDFNIMCTGTCKTNKPVCIDIYALGGSKSDTLFCPYIPFQNRIIQNFWEKNEDQSYKYKSFFWDWERHEVLHLWRGLWLIWVIQTK